MIQCKDSIVILRRSEDRRRICIKVYVDRFLTALRLSFSSLLGIVRKRPLHSPRSSIRFVQNDKGLGIRAQPAGHARRQPDVCGPPPAKAAARTEEPPDATTFVQKPLFRTLRRIPHSDCFTAPAAGYRFRETGALANTGTLGAAWSSSPSAAENTGASDLWCHAAGVKPLDSSGRAHGFPVRCVQHLQTAFILFALPLRTDRAPVVAGALLRRGLPPDRIEGCQWVASPIAAGSCLYLNTSANTSATQSA